MKQQEYLRLWAYWQAQRAQRRITARVTTKRHNKCQKTGTGQLHLKTARITSDCPVERLFLKRP